MGIIIDDSSRMILAYGEFDRATTENSIKLVQEVIDKYKHIRVIREIISDHGTQFCANKTDSHGNSKHSFSGFLKSNGIKQILCRVKHPQSNGKVERLHKTIKHECIRPKTPLTIEDARDVVEEFVEHYNTERLHSSIDYIAPVDKLKGRAKQILKTRDDKLNKARETRKISRNKNNLLIGIKKGEKVETYKRLLVAGGL